MSDAAAAEPEPKDKKHGWSAVFNLIMLVVGAGALAWMLSTTSWHELRNVLVGVGWWAAVILAIELASLCCDAASLQAFMRPEARMVSYARVLGAYASGRAINVLTPFGALGEATKVSMLEGYVPRSRILSSLVIRNVGALYLDVAVILIGIPITMLLVDLPHAIKITVLIGLAVLIPAMVMLGAMIHRGAMASAVGMLRRAHVIKPERAKAWKAKLVDVDKHIRELHRHPTAGTRAGLLFILLSKILTSASTILILVAVGVDLTPSLVIGVLSVGHLITWISSIVPLGIGLADGGNYELYKMLGAGGEHGMFVTMLGRARTVLVAILGLGAMAAINLLGRLGQWQVHRKLVRMKAERT